MSLVRQSRGGRDNVSEFGERMEGQGVFADLIKQRFSKAHGRLGYQESVSLDTGLFSPPKPVKRQMDMFDE